MTPSWIVLHDSDSKYGNPFIVDSWHETRGFEYRHPPSGTSMHVGYHYLVCNGAYYSSGEKNPQTDGLIIPCRPEEAQGAHCRANGRNSDSIGVCLIGPPYTKKQVAGLLELVLALQEKYGIPAEHVVGHKEEEPLKSDPRLDMTVIRGMLNQIKGGNHA